MTARRRRTVALGLLLLLGLTLRAAAAPEPTEQPRPLAIPDVALRNERGEKVRLVSDVLAGKVVALSFVFTTCASICPLLGATFQDLQKRLDSTGTGRDVRLVSLTVDPQVDTPERLHEWGARFGAGPNWTLLTGDKRDVDTALQAFGVATGDKVSHTPLVLVGDGTTLRFTRVHGLAGAEKILAAIQESRTARKEAATGDETRELRGLRIYRQGLGRTERPAITATLPGGTSVPAAAVPCRGCHGADGRGRSEAGVVPKDIRWTTLTDPGRSPPAYTDQALARAISAGIDPAGRPLSPAMPRYQMSSADMLDLLSYLRTLGSREPGVSSSAITIGAVLPARSTTPDWNAALQGALLAEAAAINRDGGIFGRTLELKLAEAPAEPAALAVSLRQFVATENPFAIVALLDRGAEPAVAALAEDEDLPILGAISQSPEAEAPPFSRHVFRLDAPPPLQGTDLAKPDQAESTKLLTALTRAAVRLLAEGLRRTGRDLTREGLVRELEKIYKLDVGEVPPITFSASRRTGISWP